MSYTCIDQPGIHVEPPHPVEASSATIPNCPPGLELLAQINRIVVVQQTSLAETFLGWESNNKYVIYNQDEEQIYYAYEESNALGRQFLGSSRGYTIHIVDNQKREVMRVERPWKAIGWAETTIEAPPGKQIGLVNQIGSIGTTDFDICRPDGTVILTTAGPNECGPAFCCSPDDKSFAVRSPNGELIGEIIKKWSGFMKEAYTDSDNFTVSFPRDLDVHAKASLIGATFLIDFLVFENNDRR